MKVFIATPLYPPDAGGPATYAKLLKDEFPKKGVDVFICSFSSVRKLPKIISHFVYLIKVLINSIGKDLILALDPVSVGYPASWVAKILNKKFIVKIVGDYAWEQGRQRFGVKDFLDNFLMKQYGWQVEFLRKIQKKVAKRAYKIIVPSEYLKKVVSQWGISNSKIEVVYNAIKISNDLPTKKEARELLGIEDNVFYAVSAGRNVLWKGFNALGSVFLDLREEDENIKLSIFHNLPHEKLILRIKSADVFILNTAYEGLSHILLEAMALETAIITTPVGGNIELIEDGVNGLLVEYNNNQAIKDAVLKLRNNPELKKELAIKAKEKSNTFTLDNMINNTLNILRS